MNSFLWPRFARAFSNDLLQQWRKIWIATLGFGGVALIVFLTNLDEPDIFQGAFAIALIVGGLVFTSTIFADMHHPLQRFHYLTLPYSNLERFLSRYVLTGPLFYLYVLLAYFIFEAVASGLARLLVGASPPSFWPFQEAVLWMTAGYFFLHSLMLTGAIYFRSYHLIKTALAWAVFCTVLGILQIVTLKLVFWDYFSSLWSFEEAIPMEPLWFDRLEVQVGCLFLLHLWMLYVAYRCLCDHEVQDEL